MARIPYFDPASAPEATLRALNGRRQINIFRLIAQSQNAAPGVLALGHTLSRGSSLDPVEREVVILRVAELTGAEYQAHEHHAVALRHGFTEEKIRAVIEYPEEGAAERLTGFEQRLIEFTDAVITTSTAPDRLFEEIHREYGDSKTVELVLLIGFYMMVGRVMNTFEVDLEDGPVDTYRFGP